MTSSTTTSGSASSVSTVTAPVITPVTTPTSAATQALANAAAATPVDTLLANIAKYQYNPAAIQQAALALSPVNIVDPTNPFVLAIETASVLTSGFMAKNEVNTRRLYPRAAQTVEDLYIHMSDVDYVNIFATPSTTVFSMLIPLDELLNRLVEDPTTGIKKLVIPRNTYFTVAGYSFSIQYPIEIMQMLHGGIQVVYDASVKSPLQPLSTNLIPSEIRQNSNDKYLYFSFETQQFDIISQTGTLDASTDYTVSVNTSKLYYYTRVFASDANGVWSEIKVTYTDQVYDINDPTAVVQVMNNTVNVTIPQIYTSGSLLNNGIRIDVYETVGPLNILLWEYPISSFEAFWQAYDPNDLNEFVAPLKAFQTIIPYSDQAVTGGTTGITFEQLRTQVINNAVGTQQAPITNAQLTSAMQDNGYQIVSNIDNITNRVFLATKPMPVPVNPNLITAAAAGVETVSFTISKAVTLNTVIDNTTLNNTITITPDTLYQNNNGVVSMVTNEQLTQLLNLPVSQRAIAVTNGNYLYTPFHYVLDMNNDEFNSRPYYLNDPVINTKLFVSENDTTLLQVGTGTYGIVTTPTGYQIQIVTQSSAAYQALPDNELFVQLAFIPEGEIARAYINGVLTGKTTTGERMFTFDLSTNYNIDSNDYISLTKFFLYTNAPRIVGASLETKFDVLYSTTAYLGPQWKPNSIDTILGNFMLPSNIQAITNEQLDVVLGYSLNTLWAQARSVISSVPYLTYKTAVPAVYTRDVYLTDATGSAVKIVNGQIQMTLLHKKGDPVLDSNGKPVNQYNIGDPILVNGQPVPSSTRDMLRNIDIMLIEGPYRFATDPSALAYNAAMVQEVVSWLTNDLVTIESQLLEQTKLYFYPKTTTGTIDVIINNGQTTMVFAGQSFLVTLYVSDAVYNNATLRTQLTTSTIQTISNQLTSPIVTIDGTEAALRAVYGDDVISVQMSGLGGSLNLPALTVLKDGNLLSIRKRLTAQSDGTLIVEEDVTIQFINHTLLTQQS